MAAAILPFVPETILFAVYISHVLEPAFLYSIREIVILSEAVYLKDSFVAPPLEIVAPLWFLIVPLGFCTSIQRETVGDLLPTISTA